MRNLYVVILVRWLVTCTFRLLVAKMRYKLAVRKNFNLQVIFQVVYLNVTIKVLLQLVET